MTVSIKLKDGEAEKFDKILKQKGSSDLKYRITPKERWLVFDSIEDYREGNYILGGI